MSLRGRPVILSANEGSGAGDRYSPDKFYEGSGAGDRGHLLTVHNYQ